MEKHLKDKINSEITTTDRYIISCDEEIEEANKSKQSAEYRKLQYVAWRNALRWVLEQE